MSEKFSFENLFSKNFGVKPPKLQLVSEEEKTLRHKYYQTAAVVLVFLLGFIATFGFVKKQALVKEQPVIKLEKKADYVLVEIAGLAKVDSARAMELALDLKKSIDDSRKDVADRKLLNRLNGLSQKLDNVRSELGLVRQVKLIEFLDPKLLKEGISAEILSGNGDRLLIFDPQNNILATVSPVDRNGQVVGGGD